jgi:hypothetical protein
VQETVTVLAREGCRGRNSPAVRSASKGEVQERESLLLFFNDEKP